MPIAIGPGGGGGGGGAGGGGGGGLHFRDPADVFVNNAARSTYFTTTEPAAYQEFVSDRSLAIIIGSIQNPTAFQTYLGDMSDAYDDSMWVSRIDAVEGPPGPMGPGGGGAIELVGEYNDTPSAANNMQATGFFYPSEDWLGISYSSTGVLIWYPTARFAALDRSAAGDTATNANRSQLAEGTGYNPSGRTGLGISALDEVLVTNTSATATHITMYRYVPVQSSVAQSFRKYVVSRSPGVTGQYTAADFTGVGSNTSTAEIINGPVWTSGTRFIAFAVPEAVGPLNWIVSTEPGAFGSFVERRYTVEIGGVPYRVYSTFEAYSVRFSATIWTLQTHNPFGSVIPIEELVLTAPKYVAVRATDDSFTAADFTGTGGAVSVNNNLTIPSWDSGNRFLAITRPASGVAYNYIGEYPWDDYEDGYIPHRPYKNVISGFYIKAVNLTINGEDHIIYVYGPMLTPFWSGLNIHIKVDDVRDPDSPAATLADIPVIRRRAAVRTGYDDYLIDTLVASDFSGVGAISTETEAITVPTLIDDSWNLLVIAIPQHEFAIKETWADKEDPNIFQPGVSNGIPGGTKYPYGGTSNGFRRSLPGAQYVELNEIGGVKQEFLVMISNDEVTRNTIPPSVLSGTVMHVRNYTVPRSTPTVELEEFYIFQRTLWVVDDTLPTADKVYHYAYSTDNEFVIPVYEGLATIRFYVPWLRRPFGYYDRRIPTSILIDGVEYLSSFDGSRSYRSIDNSTGERVGTWTSNVQIDGAVVSGMTMVIEGIGPLAP